MIRARDLDQDELELLRHACLEFLSQRSLLAFSAQAIAALLEKKQMVDFSITPAMTVEACSLLAGLGLLSETPDQYGATIYYKVTAKGILENERSGRQVIPE